MCGCIVYPLAYFLGTVFLMMITGLPPTPALIITAILTLALGLLRLRLGLYAGPQYITARQRNTSTANTANTRNIHPRVNFRDIQANKRIARGQNSMFDHNRQNRMARRIWNSQNK